MSNPLVQHGERSDDNQLYQKCKGSFKGFQVYFSGDLFLHKMSHRQVVCAYLGKI